MTHPHPARNLLVIDGHPDPAPHFVHVLADAYAEGARSTGNTVSVVRVAELEFPVLRSPEEWMHGTPPAAIQQAQAQILAAQHIAMFYPLWLGDVPALFKAFLEQVMRPDFAIAYRDHAMPKKLLKGRSCRVVVSMGMPALAYRLYYRAHSLRSLERNILRFTGIGPVETTLIGGVEDAETREDALERMRVLGSDGA